MKSKNQVKAKSPIQLMTLEGLFHGNPSQKKKVKQGKEDEKIINCLLKVEGDMQKNTISSRWRKNDLEVYHFINFAHAVHFIHCIFAAGLFIS